MGEGIFENLRHDPPDFHLRYERITEYNDENEEASIQDLLRIIKLQARGKWFWTAYLSTGAYNFLAECWVKKLRFYINGHPPPSF